MTAFYPIADVGCRAPTVSSGPVAAIEQGRNISLPLLPAHQITTRAGRSSSLGGLDARLDIPQSRHGVA